MNCYPHGKLFFLLFIIAGLFGCDQGLEPEPPQTYSYGISGIVYLRHWPPIDSVKDLRVVAFKDYPRGNVVDEVLQGNAKYSTTLLPYGADSIIFQVVLSPLPPGRFEYIAVAQQYGDNLRQDWRAVGLYRDQSDTTRPGTLIVRLGEMVTGVELYVDFNNLPPQPQP